MIKIVYLIRLHNNLSILYQYNCHCSNKSFDKQLQREIIASNAMSVKYGMVYLRSPHIWPVYVDGQVQLDGAV